MIEPKRPLRVFLCHAPMDRDVVYALYTRLTCDGMDVWLGKEKLLPGQDWELEIRKAVRAADVIIVCLSKEFNQAGYQHKEVRIALNEAEMQPEGIIFIIPIRLEECDIPESLKSWHWVDLFEADAYEMLIRALRMRADSIGSELRVSKSIIDDPVKKTIAERLTTPTPLSKMTNRQKQSETKKHGSQTVKKSSVPKPKAKKRKAIKTETIVALMGIVATIIAGILSSPLIEKLLVVSPNSTSTVTPPIILTEVIAMTAKPYPTNILDTDLAGNSIPMQFVPAGEFEMGSEYGVNDGNLVHSVNVDAFYIDTYEVTNMRYKACVSAGACQPPKNASSYARTSYYINIDFDNYPVVNVNWHMAESYCKWRGAQLPTEAQWEKAARGGLKGKSYPWGDTAPVCEEGAENGAKFDDKAECDAIDTERVGSYSPNGFGLYDMAGNVWEWTGSLYRHYPYGSDDGRENLEAYGARVLRGGSWFNVEYLQRVSFRNKGYPDLVSYLIGFRCARSVP